MIYFYIRATETINSISALVDKSSNMKIDTIR